MTENSKYDVRKRMRDYYQSSHTYHAQLSRHEAEAALFYVNWVTDFAPAGARLLDLGCGTGASTRMFYERGFDVVGVDLSYLFLSSGHTQYSLPLVVGDALDMPLASGSFDVVASAALIEHLPNVAQALQEMLRVLKKDGLLFILAPNHCSLTMPAGDFLRLMRGADPVAHFR